MRIRKSQLRKLIKEVIQEAGTSGTRGGVAVPGSSDEYTRPTFKGSSNSRPRVIRNLHPDLRRDTEGYEYIDIHEPDEDSASSQSLDSSWNQGYGQSSTQDLDSIGGDDLDMRDSGLNEDSFSFIIDSQSTRGKTGQLKHVSSGKTASLQQGSSDVLSDLSILYQKGGNKKGKERAEEVCKAFMDRGYWVEEPVTSAMMLTIGVKGMQTGKLYQIEDYFNQFQNGLFRQGGQLIERKRLKRRK
jgi:hypothetical protein